MQNIQNKNKTVQNPSSKQNVYDLSIDYNYDNVDNRLNKKNM